MFLLVCVLCSFFFFFSSRRRHTRWNCDWSSDVCSSDLAVEHWGRLYNVEVTWFHGQLDADKQLAAVNDMAKQTWDFVAIQPRSEERRVGKECRYRWSPYH